MTGDVYSYNSSRIYIMSGEKRIIIEFTSSDEYQKMLKKGMRIGKSVIFDEITDEIIEFF